jgi:hypothetical protein
VSSMERRPTTTGGGGGGGAGDGSLMATTAGSLLPWGLAGSRPMTLAGKIAATGEHAFSGKTLANTNGTQQAAERPLRPATMMATAQVAPPAPPLAAATTLTLQPLLDEHERAGHLCTAVACAPSSHTHAPRAY